MIFVCSVNNFVNNNSLRNLLINLGIIRALIILVLFFIPVILKCLGSPLHIAQREIQTLNLLNERRGAATDHKIMQ